jgi:glycosyltransferase involved in cell wall biosynthesis
MRLLIVSDSPHAPSGYGQQLAQFAPALRDLGHDVAILAAFGHHGMMTEFKGIPMYPGGLDGFGNDVIGPAARQHQADLVITLKDLWVYRPQEWGAGIRWAPMVPVDHEPIPDGITQLLRQWGALPIAYSQFGEQQLLNAGFAPVYAPHTYDPAIMHPMDKAEARTLLGVPPDCYAIGMVAVNRGGDPSRKAWPQNLEGFARYARQNPRARLFCHTHVGETGREGAINLPALCQQLGIIDRVAFPPQEDYDRGMPADYLRAFYSAMDVLNCASVGEGFGVPTLEAQACGTPVIIGDWTSSSELLFAGVAIDRNDAFKYYDRQMAYIYLPEPHALAGAFAEMERRCATEAPALRARAVAGAAPYAIDRVRDTHWRAALETLAARLTRPGVARIVHPDSVLVSTEGAAWAEEARG